MMHGSGAAARLWAVGNFTPSAAAGIAAAAAGLLLTGCGSSSSADPCEAVVCGGSMQCVNGACVAKPLNDAGTNPGPDASNDGGSGLDVTTNYDGPPSEATECFAGEFPWTNSQEAFTVPAGARWMHVKAWGGGANQEGTCPGGVGGYAEGIFEVTAGTELVFIVGAPGHAADAKAQMLLGWGQSGGSGLTGVFSGPGLVLADEFAKAWLIAGGGGGAGVQSGGGPCIPGVPGNNPNASMPTMEGGLGLDDNVNGGGGGFRGGAGGKKGERGLGGSGFVDQTRVTDFLLLNAEIGDEQPKNTGDPDYKSPAGVYENPGLLVVKFTCDKPVIDPPK
jgi:hypothetical protein